MDALVDFLLNFYGPTPYMLIVGILLACGVGLPIPEDITLFAAGLLSYYGLTNLWLMMGLAFLGVIFGDTIIFILGATYGRKLTKYWIFARLLPEDRLKMVQGQLKERGKRFIFAARFMPGLRAPIFFSAGLLHLPYRGFVLYDGAAALISVPSIIGAVYYFGDELDQVVRVIHRIEHGIGFLIGAAVLAVAAKWYMTHKKLGRAREGTTS